MSNNITIEFCKEDRKRIDEVVSLLGLLVTTAQGKRTTPEDLLAQSGIQTRSAEGPVEKAEHPADAPATHLEPVVAPATTEPEPPAVESVPEPEVKPISLAEFQKAVTLAVSKGPEAKKAAKAVINKYAPSVSEVPEDKRSEVVAELAKL